MPRAGWGELAYRYRRAIRVEQSARASGVRLPAPVPDITGEALTLIDLPHKIDPR
jgi:hypothetical protein